MGDPSATGRGQYGQCVAVRNLVLGKTSGTARRDAPDAKFHSAGSNVKSERRSGFGSST